MKQSSFFSQWLILGIALLYLGGSVAFNLNRERQRVDSSERERLLTQARVVRENTAHNLTAIKQVLMQLRLQKKMAGQELNEHLATLTDAMPGVRTVAILDAKGVIRAANRPELVGGNFSQRDYFSGPRQGHDADTVYVSRPFRSSLGVFALGVSMAIIGPHGEFSGVVTATLDPQYFFNLMDSVRYTPDMRTGLVHWDGDIFMMAPAQTAIAGKNLNQPSAFFTQHKGSDRDANVYVGKVYSTGDERMVALSTIRSPELKLDKPLVVTASRDVAEIFSAWRSDLVKQGGMAALIALLSILVLYAFQRRQRESGRQLEHAGETLRAKQVEIQESEEKYRAIVETTDTGYVILDGNGRVVDANAEYIRLSGYASLEQILGHNPVEWTAQHDQERNREAIRKCLETGAIRNFEIEYSDPAGQATAVEINATVLRRKGERQIVALCRDVSERKRAQEEIRHLAYHDALTNLPNRRMMLERLSLAIVQAKRYQRSLAIMFIDLDHFKEINDTLGHDVGDELLSAVAKRLSACVRGGDTVSRQGGDEFVVVLTEIAQVDDATLVAEKIVKVMREPVPVREHVLQITISIGIAIYPLESTDDPIELMKKADIAMYKAKKGGRDGYCVYQ
ncbi:MAG: Cyclic di-GMP phosphodiesterase Gmr [Betaproteobacteria bacterium ADurb.Bin341]|nr:MAG: Cyclic di-GMP phosphodiesterase Gmr [Betaproteobacteria bacterium ADurb.Bin341]